MLKWVTMRRQGAWKGMWPVATQVACRLAALTLLVWGLWPVGASAQGIQGRVTDPDGVPVPRAEVVLLDAATGLQRFGTVTGAEGAFRFEAAGSGRYTLRVYHVGYGRAERAVSAQDASPVHIVLSQAALDFPEVVVTGARARAQLTPVTATNLDRAAIERRPEMKDLPAHLSTLPSITYYSENGNDVGYSYLQMRGFGQRRLAVAINGIPQNDPEEFNVFWINFFDIQGVIDDIQVQRGAGSAFYGPAAIGGAINIRAMPYKPYPYARLETGAGAYGTRRLSVSGNTGLLDNRWVVYGRLSRLESDGYRDGAWTEFWRFFGGVTRYGERSTLTLQTYGGPQRDGLAYVGIPKAANSSSVDDGFGGTIDRRYNYSAAFDEVEDFHQPHVEMIHNLQLGDGLSLDQALFWVRGVGYFDFDGSFRSADYLRLPAGFVPAGQEADPLYLSRPDVSVFFRAYLDQWQVGWQPSLTWRRVASETRLGGEVRLHRSLRWGRTEESWGIPSEFVGSGADYRVYSFRGEKSIQSVYGSHLMRLTPRVALQADVQATHRRYRVFDEAFFGTEFARSYFFVNPRVGVTINPERPVSGYVSLALAGREPRMKSLYDGEEAGAGFEPQFARNPDGTLDTDRPVVKPEQLIDLEVGGTLRSAEGYVTANVYHMEFRDEIVPSGELDQFGVPRTGNADRTRHSGVELDGGLQVLPWLDLAGNVSFSRNRFVEFLEYATLPDYSVVPLDRSGNTIAGFPSRLANLVVTARRDGLTASLFAQFVGRQYVDNSGGTLPDGTASSDLEVDPYRMVNLSLRWDVAAAGPLEGLEALLDVNNLLDEKVLTYGNAGFGAPQFFPAAERHLFVGLRWTVR